MPFETKTISQAKDHEPVSRGLGKAMREVKQMVPGESRLDVIGEELSPEEAVIESLSPQEDEEKTALAKIILKFVEPLVLSRRRPNPVADELSFNEKVAAMTLVELRRFFPKGFDPKTIDLREGNEEF